MIGRACLALIVLALLATACHRMTEEEALEAAREEIRREMQAEIDRRREEIAEMRREIAEIKSRIAARQAEGSTGRSP